MSSPTTQAQVSAGGVAFRRRGRGIQVALISVGETARWQLPKGLVGRGEELAVAARREVREEAGLETELIDLIETIEYWYFGTVRSGKRVRFHKRVHFYLMRATGGDVADHDHEVNEARWFRIDEAVEALAFASEKKVVAKAKEMILALR